MGNTIQHPRKRPRKRSLNWRALWWLISREAAWTILRGFQWSRPPSTFPARFSRIPMSQLHVRCERLLLRLPSRRYYP